MCCQLMSGASTDMQGLVHKIEERTVVSTNAYDEDIASRSFKFSKGSRKCLTGFLW